MINFVFRTSNNYFPQALLEECEYVVKGKKTLEYLIDGIKISSVCDTEDSDEKNSNEDNSVEGNFDEEN